MSTNWDAVVKIASSLLAVVVAWALKAWSERGPKVIAYYGHSSAVVMPKTVGADEVTVHTHSVVVRNVGKKTATNVRVSHYRLPPFSVYPAVAFRLEAVPNSGPDIVIPTLVPAQQVTINYAYFPPVYVSGVTSGVRTDEAFAMIVDVFPTPRPSPQIRATRIALNVVGAATLVYWATVVALRWIRP